MPYKWFIHLVIAVMLGLSTGIVNAAFSVKPSFESSEHIAAGDQLQIAGLPSSDQRSYRFELPNGLQFTYGQIMALAGDFYAIPEQAISEGKTPAQLEANFIAAYQTLAVDSAAVAEAPQIFAVIQSEQDTLYKEMQNGKRPEDIFKTMGEENNKRWNCITGGGCSALWYLNQGRFLKIAKHGFDHFGQDAWIAYSVGHALALKTALAAHQTRDAKLLENAYAINAFASHFLSDRFASGHLRTPFVPLFNHVTPATVGSVLVTFMHNEENSNPLQVTNLRGDKWMLLGDRYYWDPRNAANRLLMIEALQASVDQIYLAYKEGIIAVEDKVAELIPMTEKNEQDITPLFYWDAENKKLLRRNDPTNLYDKNFTDDWWGWTTLIMLSKQRGLPTEAQQALVAAGYGQQALAEGLIEDAAILHYLKTQLH